MAYDPADFEVIEDATPTAEVGSRGLPLAVAQGMTGGFSDEIQGALAALPIALLKGQSIPDSYREGRDIARTQQREFKEQFPKTAIGAEIAGGLTGALTGGGLAAALAGRAAPQTAARIGEYAVANPLKTAAGIGALSGSVYGAGTSEGDLPQAAKEAALGGVVGAAAGPVGARIGQMILPKSLSERAAALVQKRRIPPTMTAPENSPLQNAQGKVARMPMGAQTMDVDLMRAEESARQGLLGPVAQTQINQMDNIFRQDVTDIAKGLAGDGESADVFANVAKTVRSRADAEKRLATALIEKRNDALGRASVYKDYAQNTLGNDVKAFLQAPDMKASVAMLGPDNAINRSVQYLDNVISSNKKAINFAELAGWRRSLNNLNPASPEYQIGKQLSSTYDNWLDNISKQALINADDDIVDKIFTANKNYREFKQKYGTDKFRGQTKIIEDIVNKTELSPLQLSNAIMGGTTKGRSDSAQIVKRIIDIVPEKKRPEMVSDLRRGLVLRAVENAYAKSGADEKMSLSTFRNELRKIKSNEAYNLYLKDAEFDKTVTSLESDLTKYLEAQSRKDVYSPSGGAVARNAEKILSAVGVLTAPVGGRVITDVAKYGVKKGAEEAAIAPTRKAFEKSLNGFVGQIRKESADMRRIYGAGASGAVSNEVSRPFLTDAQGNTINYDDFEELE